MTDYLTPRDGAKSGMGVEFDANEVGFEPAVSATGASSRNAHQAVPKRPRRRPRGRRGWRRKVTSGVMLAVVLAGVGGAYTMFATSSGANDTRTSQQDVDAGQLLYNVSCICGGAGGTRTHDPGIMRPLIHGSSNICGRFRSHFRGSYPSPTTTLTTVSRHV